MEWLSINGYNTDKVGAVEISNARIFLNDSTRLNAHAAVHELAHARQFFLEETADLDFIGPFESAVASGNYESVEYATGIFLEPYALTNYKEYFAELSEAYFGTNDYFPFNRSELQSFDPIGYEMVHQAWN